MKLYKEVIYKRDKKKLLYFVKYNGKENLFFEKDLLRKLINENIRDSKVKKMVGKVRDKSLFSKYKVWSRIELKR